jgi:hypothetical protein
MTILKGVISGNGSCHCLHVEDLIKRVTVLESNPRAAPPGQSGHAFVPDPWTKFQNTGQQGHASDHPAGSVHDVASPEALPLKLMQPLGSIGYKDRPLFDHKMTLQDEFKFNGVKDGYKWKGKVENYMMACAPVMMEILRWADRQNMEPIKWETISYAVSTKMTEDQAASMVTQV